MKKIIIFLLFVSVAFISCSSGSGDDSYAVPIVNGVLDNSTNNDPTNNPNTNSESNQENGSQQGSSVGYIKIKNETTSIIYLYEDGDSFRANLKSRIPAKSEYTIESKTGIVTYYYSFMIDIGGAFIPWYSSDVNSFSAFSVQVSENKVVTQKISFPNSMEASSSYIVLKNSSGSAIKVFKDTILLSPVDYPENILINSGEQFVYEIKQEDFDKRYLIKNAIGTSSYEINQAIGSFEPSRIYKVEFSDSVKLIESTRFNKTKYTVEYYRENLNGEYSLYDSQEMYGIVGKKTNVLPEEYIGFESKPFEQITLEEKASPIVKIYYTRKIIKLTFNCDPGKFNDGTSKETITGKYGEQVFYTNSPVKEFYNFDGWEGRPEEFPSEDLTIHAKWSPLTYSISYELNGGTNAAENPSNYTVESSTITLKSPARNGYVFEGWYDSNSFSKKVSQIQSGSNGAVKFYAKWKLLNYSITYHLNGGSNSETNPSSYSVLSDIITLNNPSRKYYNFAGWYSDSGMNNPANAIPHGSTGDREFHAKWNPVEYPISYSLNGGTNSDLNPPYYTVEMGTVSLSDPYRIGYAFDGWYSEGAFENRITSITEVPGTSINLYAKWKLLNYSITYHLDGGFNSISNPSVYTVESNRISLGDPIKSYYNFAGWYLESNFVNSVSYIPNGSVGNKEFFAKWIPVIYSIDYHLNGGINHGSNPRNYTVESNGITLQNPKRVGYEFNGWYSEDYFANEVSAIANGSNGDRNLYAKWTPISYSIMYHLDGGVNSISNPSIYTVESDTFYFSSPSKSGYSFMGWYEDREFSRAVEKIIGGTIGNRELYAKWISNSLSINVTMPENYRDIEGLSYSEENGILKLQASSGYQSYRWYFDDEIVSGNSNACSIDVSLPSVRAGVHFAMVVVKDNSGKTYSAQMQIVVRK